MPRVVGGIPQHLKQKRRLRSEVTKAELLLWSKLRGCQFHSLKFRRQHGIGSYIVDFYCPDRLLVIEIDGDIHAQGNRKKMDCQREAYLTTLGLKVIRYPNDDVLNNLDGVLQDLENKIFSDSTSPCPSLQRRGKRNRLKNMSLNSFVTPEGGEMGRAQVLQAQACGLLPHVDMNPILLKPEADQRSQVIVQGKIWGTQDANGYFGCRPELFGFVRDSYERLAKDYQVIVIEGAGSAAEVNLRDRDLVNWPVVELANAVVVLVADIDRGGVFAQVIGTLDLIDPKERQRVLGIVVNKFRGDLNLFTDGVAFLEERTGLPVLGVLPFLRDLQLDQEDSVGVDRSSQAPFGDRTVNVAVVLLPHMSNFTDFNALAAEEDVVLRYAATPAELSRADVVILPGSKTTIADLAYLKNAGYGERLVEYVDQGGELVGICGGFQMLGHEISDPLGVEMGGLVKGLGLLEVKTVLHRDKKTVQVVATPAHLGSAVGLRVRGYEIHMGETRRLKGKACFTIIQIFGQERPEEDREDGAWREDKLVWGTYIHGVFDQPAFRRAWLNRVRERKGLPQIDPTVSEAVTARLCSALDRWADHVEQHVHMGRIFSALNLK